MNEILAYLQSKGIEGTMRSHFNLENIPNIIFNYCNAEIIVFVNSETTLEDFIKKANEKYQEHLKSRFEFYESMSRGYKKQVDDHKPILT
jgi:hypothetical protein